MSAREFTKRDALQLHTSSGEDQVTPEMKRKAAIAVADRVPKEDLRMYLDMLGLL